MAFQVSPISDVNIFNKTCYIQRKLETRIHHQDRDIVNLQSTEDLVQDKKGL